MALDVNYIYQFALKLMRKNQAGPFPSVEFQYQWNDAQATYQDDLLGRFQARNNGKTGINTGLIDDETILQKLSPFTKPITLAITMGQAPKPADFVYRLAMRVGGLDCYKINQNQIANVNRSVIDPPAANKSYFVEYENYYLFLPSSLTAADLDYIATPVDILWAYTFDVDERQVYDSVNSVQPVWDSNSCREITKRMFTNIGVSFKDADFENFGKSVQAVGE